MATQFSYQEVEEAKEEVRDQLSAAITRRNQLTWAAQQPDATDGDRRAAQVAGEAVGRLQDKLDGLEYGSQEISAEERDRQASERAASARELAVETLALIHLHSWRVEQADEALVTASNLMEEVEGVANQIQLGIGVFGDGLQGESAARGFLALLGIGDMADIPAQFERDVRIRRYARALPNNRDAALRALAKVLPESLEPEVRAEGLARARQRFDEAAKTGGNND